MQGFLGERLNECQTGKITPDEFDKQLKQRAIQDARVLRHLKKSKIFAELTDLISGAGNDHFRAMGLANFQIEMIRRPLQEELTSLTTRLLTDRACVLAGKGEIGQRQAGRLLAHVDTLCGR
jgi:hypothetical protein